MKTKLAIVSALALLCAFTGCTSATASKVGKDGTTDSIQVKSFLSTIKNGAYTSAGTNGPGITLTVTDTSPDQEAIGILAGGIVELSKAAMVFAAKAPTNSAPVTTNAP